MRALNQASKKPYSLGSDLVGGAGLDVGDIGYFAANPGAGYLSPGGQIVKQADYPALVGKLPLVAQNAAIGTGNPTIPNSQGSANLSRQAWYGSRIYLRFGDYNTSYYAHIYKSDDGGASYSSILDEYAAAILPFAADAFLYIRQSSGSALYLYYWEGGTTYSVGVNTANASSLDPLARNPVNGRVLAFMGNSIYRSDNPKSGYALVQSPGRYFTAAAYNEAGLCIAATTQNSNILVSTDDFATYTEVVIPYAVSPAVDGVYSIAYENGIWLLGGNGRILRCAGNPAVAGNWSVAYTDPSGNAQTWNSLVLMGGVAYAGTYSAYLESANAGLTFTRTNLSGVQFVGRGPSSFLRGNGFNGSTYPNILRYQSFPGVQLPNLLGSRTDAKAPYLKAA